MHSDQRQPGWAVSRAALTPPRSTISKRVLPGVRHPSADPTLFLTTPAISCPPLGSSPSAVHLARPGAPRSSTGRWVLRGRGRWVLVALRSGVRAVVVEGGADERGEGE